jgi:hypothetical protein
MPLSVRPLSKLLKKNIGPSIGYIGGLDISPLRGLPGF